MTMHPPPCFSDFYRNKKVFITGHTGFKGSWLSEWLLMTGAEVTGFSLEPEDHPSLFQQLGLENRLRHHLGDIRDETRLKEVFYECKPDVVFHLAAQPLVRRSYRDPISTYQINVMGTAHLLNVLRTYSEPCSAVFVTSDKCYENHEHARGYREDSPMGGHDPYSSSKGAAELVIRSFRRSYFSRQREAGDMGSMVAISSARAGNVIGGGDWAEDRIVPDCIRSLMNAEPIVVRNKKATRPWQHVLEPLSGYLSLAALTHPDGRFLSGAGEEDRDRFASFNFGPLKSGNRTVEELVTRVLAVWPGEWKAEPNPSAPHEATLLSLNIEKAAKLLQWTPVWNFDETVDHTVSWYRNALSGKPSGEQELTRQQILSYIMTAAGRKVPWALGAPCPPVTVTR